jgi:hypothetical protein
VTEPKPVPFASNEIRLSPAQWLVAGAVVATVFVAAPYVWTQVEPFDPGPDYRLPYSLSSDYWLYSRWCGRAAPRGGTPVVGDSVVWGHYVDTDQTLSHHLTARIDGGGFANLGVDGIHPVALAGLLEYYAGDLRGRKVLLHCNLLWMSSERHDLQSRKEFAFNHPRLVPQFVRDIPCYRESTAGRVAIVIERHLTPAAWLNHLEAAYFDNRSLPMWTVDHPYANPLEAVTLDLPSPDEPPAPRPDARPWTEKRMPRFDAPWVALDDSLQWRSFQRAVAILRERGNRVFVLVGPFNEHMLTEESRAAYQERKRLVGRWLAEQGIPHLVPAPLPSNDYADASHPLGRGYARQAERLHASETFRRFLRAATETEASE